MRLFVAVTKFIHDCVDNCDWIVNDHIPHPCDITLRVF